MVASGAKLSLDAPPFALVAGDRARLVGLNEIGLRRRNVGDEALVALKAAFRVLFRSGLRFEKAVEQIRLGSSIPPQILQLLHFLEKSERGFCR